MKSGNFKKSVMSSANFQEALDRQVEKARNSLDVTLNPDDPDLMNQITLGDEWDNPQVLGKALDLQPLYYARWATLLRGLKRERSKCEQRYNVWESITKDRISEMMFEENKKKGMTPSNSKPAAGAVSDRFNALYTKLSADKTNKKKFAAYLKYKVPLDDIQHKIDIIEVVVKAFEMRGNTLISLGHLVRTMIEKGLVVMKLPSKRQK